jgi:putative transcriptional regulator
MLPSVQTSLAPGFLIAMPQLGDPNFHQSVVLMLEHGDQGSMGLVINRQAPFTLKEVAASQPLRIHPGRNLDRVYIGGPVEPQRGFVLHDCATVEEKQEILPGVFLSVTLDALQPLMEETDSRFRFCLGYSGWGAQQLEAELKIGSWLFTEARAETLWSSEVDGVWDATIRSMGLDPGRLVMGKGVH